MRAARSISAALIATLVAAAAAAGGGHKCDYSAQQCLDSLAARCESGGWVGIELEGDMKSGYTVTRVLAASPAESAGLQTGDRLVSLDGVALTEANQAKLKEMKLALAPGTEVTYRVQRQGAEREVKIKLGKMPKEVATRMVGEHMLEHATVARAAK